MTTADRPRLAAAGAAGTPGESAPGMSATQVDLEDLLGHLLEQADLRQLVDLKGLVLVAAGHVADDGRPRGTLSSRASPMPVQALVTPGPGTTQRTPGRPVLRA